MGLIGVNKRFKDAAISPPGSTYDSLHLLAFENTKQYHKILEGKVLPEKSLTSEEFWGIPLVTVGNNAFLQHPWLIEAC